MIYATGDTHTDWMPRLSNRAFPEQREMTKDDYVVILGDFGIRDGVFEKGDPRIIREAHPFWKEYRRKYRQFRINHVSWWERELPSEEELEYAILFY